VLALPWEFFLLEPLLEPLLLAPLLLAPLLPVCLPSVPLPAAVVWQSRTNRTQQR